MQNYGEEIAYWYFRLNGFFPISNFVVHRDGEHDNAEYRYNRDCDILAVRPVNVFEDIGGQHTDWDETLFNSLDMTKQLGVICEVKTGQVERIFSNHMVETAIMRLGLIEEAHWNNVLRGLQQAAIWENETCQLAKILISANESEGEHIHIPLDYVVYFIKNRMEKYQNEKYSARTLFNSSLLQFFMDPRL